MKSTGDLQSAKQRQWREVSPALDSRWQLPFSPGVYVFYGRNNNVLYVGKSKILRNRVSSYFQSRADLIPKVRLFVPQISKIKISQTNTEFEALLLEARLIREMGPKYNSRLTDDRSPLYIAVTDEKFPRVLTARKTDLGGVEARSVYGPFLSGETVKRILKIGRKLFPFCNDPRRHFFDTLGSESSLTSSSPKIPSSIVSKMPPSARLPDYRPCFYRHLGLCPGVCCGEISRRRYLSIIKKLEQFLAGDFDGLKGKLEREMKLASKRKDYELAAGARDAAEALNSLTLAGEYEEEMGMSTRERVEAVIKLLKFRASAASYRIEGFDVSNLKGRLATAAMAVFIGGTKDPGEYRHFQIRRSFTPDDPRMIAEAVERRLGHPEWGKPDLVIIDGGGPQLSMIQRELRCLTLLPGKIPYLGFAKSPDRLIIPTKSGFKTVTVSSRDLGFQLLQQVRDEAHRFSRKLHLGLRRKALIE